MTTAQNGSLGSNIFEYKVIPIYNDNKGLHKSAKYYYSKYSLVI